MATYCIDQLGIVGPEEPESLALGGRSWRVREETLAGATQPLHGAVDMAGSTQVRDRMRAGAGNPPDRARPRRPTDGRPDFPRTEAPAGSGETRQTVQHRGDELPRTDPALRCARLVALSRVNLLSRIHNPVGHHPWSLTVRLRAAGPPDSLVATILQRACTEPAPLFGQDAS